MKKGWGKGQASIEFLVVFGFVFLMMLPLILIFFDQAGVIEDSIAENQLRNLAVKIVEKAESVYYLGEPSRTTIKAVFPPRVESITISPRQVTFYYRTRTNRLREIPYASLVNLTGGLSLSPGQHTILIESSGGAVSISEP